MNDLSEKLADADERFWPLAKRYAPTLKDVIINCSWRFEPYNCSDLFHEVLTDEGICFSFNYQNASELYKEDAIHEHFHVTRHDKPSYDWKEHYPLNITEEMFYPRRVFVGSEGLRFELSLNKKDKDYACSGPVQSFKIQLHSSDDHPHMHRNFYRIPMSHDIVMSVNPNIMNSTDQLIKNYKYEKRQCVNAKEDDRTLQYFKKYTQRNCHLNELSFRQNKDCHCVAFWLPRAPNQTVCRSVENLKCIERSESDAVVKVMNGSQISFNCMPSCRSISYNAEISMSEYEIRNYELYVTTKERSTNDFLKSRVLITFRDEQFFASRRAEMYSEIDFIASCGGILGLFMGFSILSIVEIVYFSTLRISCSLRKRRQVKKRRLKQLKIIDELNGGGNVHEASPEHSEYDNVPKLTY